MHNLWRRIRKRRNRDVNVDRWTTMIDWRHLFRWISNFIKKDSGESGANKRQFGVKGPKNILREEILILLLFSITTASQGCMWSFIDITNLFFFFKLMSYLRQRFPKLISFQIWKSKIVEDMWILIFLEASNLEQVLAATPHKTPTIRPPASHHENYPS